MIFRSHKFSIPVLFSLAFLVCSFVFTSALAAQGGECDGEVSSVQALVELINRANSEDSCPGPNVITVTANLDVDSAASNDNYAQQGASAFPVITSDITINGVSSDGNRVTISRNSTTGFRFFLVDARNANGRLTLNNLVLENGNAQRGGAIYVDGSLQLDQTDTLLTVSNSSIHSNSATVGGAIYLNAVGSARASALISSSVIEGNSVGSQGGALYNDARSNGIVVLKLLGSRIVDNRANAEGGALFNNAAANGGQITIEATDTYFLENTQQRTADVQCFNNGQDIHIDNTNRSTDASCGDATPVTVEEAQQLLAEPMVAEMTPVGEPVVIDFGRGPNYADCTGPISRSSLVASVETSGAGFQTLHDGCELHFDGNLTVNLNQFVNPATATATVHASRNDAVIEYYNNAGDLVGTYSGLDNTYTPAAGGSANQLVLHTNTDGGGLRGIILTMSLQPVTP